MPGVAEPINPRQVDLVLHQVDTLPTLSPIATRLLSIGSPEDADLDEIVNLIESDPALTGKILSLCRRADKGLGNAVSTVRKAVIMLGLETVQGAVLSVCVYELLDQAGRSIDETERPARFDRRGFWKHSVAVACASDMIASAHPRLRVRPDQAFVAGLLHDMGKLVMELVLPSAYAKVIELAEHRQIDSAGVERSLVGIDHHTAGKRVAEKWGLPRELQDVMWLHSQSMASVPADLPHRDLVAIVTAAKALCRSLYLGWSGDFAQPAPIEEICDECGLDPTMLEGIGPDLHEAVTARCAALGIDDETSPELLMQSIAQANRQMGRINAILEERSRTSRVQTRVLEAIESFQKRATPGAPVFDTLAAVVRSAGKILGEGFYGVVFQAPDEAWQVLQFSTEGRLLRSQMIEAPGQASVADLADTGELSISAMGILPWLTDFLGDAADIRRVRLIPLRAGRGTEAHGSALLMHDRDLSEAGVRTQQLAALVSTWASAFAASAEHEQAVRLGERLADANRELAEAQAKLTESASMARLGEMTAGAAHEMNNPLTIIAGRSQMLSERADSARDRATALAILASARELSDLISSLHLIADPPEPERRRASLMDTLEKSVESAKQRSGANAQVQLRVPGGMPPIDADPSFIERATTELISNAIEARPSGAVDVYAKIDPQSDALSITVADRGPGLSPKAQRHAFDPFFSEKPAGRQCGLGLARAKRLIELHAGRIELRSTPGEGTTATITLSDWRHTGEEPRAREAA